MRIRTKRLFLMPPHLSDAKIFVSWLNDPEVVRYSEQRHKVHTVTSQEDYWLSPATAPPNGIQAIYLADGGIPIGSTSYTVDLPNNVANVGILIGDKSKWGHGYGFEAWEATCDYLFKDGIRKIEAGCMRRNMSMVAICVKYGMDLEGNRNHHFLTPLEGTDDLLMFGRFKP